jgi:hypothetical protein
MLFCLVTVVLKCTNSATPVSIHFMDVFSYVTDVSFLRIPKPESLLATHIRTSPANPKQSPSFLPSLFASFFCPRPTHKTSTITIFLLFIGLRCAVLLKRCTVRSSSLPVCFWQLTYHRFYPDDGQRNPHRHLKLNSTVRSEYAQEFIRCLCAVC